MDAAEELDIARLEAALGGRDPVSSAYDLAVKFRDSGMPQDRLFRIFDTVRARHRDDTDESRYDAVMDVLDFIGGWCSPGRLLYPPQAGAK